MLKRTSLCECKKSFAWLCIRWGKYSPTLLKRLLKQFHANPIRHQKEAVAPSIGGKPVLQPRRQLLALEWPQEHLQVVAS